ncbi:MAG: cytochrome c1 [Alphaproteobacteria bacterium]|nr:cytochrome c1 [Alphaproteobacteria bacterium]
MRKLAVSVIALSGLIAGSIAPIVVMAAGGSAHPKGQHWSFGGIFGTYDKPQLRRGFQVYQEVCAACHSLRHVAYRNLSAIGLDEKAIEAIAAEKELPGEPDEEGEATTRKALPSDKFVPPFANENAARSANNGALPPDLSLMTKARIGGPDYLYALLTGYGRKQPKYEVDGHGEVQLDEEKKPVPFKLGEGLHYNPYFPGLKIAMGPPLSDEGVEYADKTKATVAQQAKDVTAFLQWAADPYLEDRKRMGIKVILFLIFLTGLLYAYKRKVWAKLH